MGLATAVILFLGLLSLASAGAGPQLICGGSGDEDSITFNCEANRPIANVNCSFDGGQFEQCTLPVDIPYGCPGLHALVLMITYSDGQSENVILPYFFSAEAPKFGLQCEGTGDYFGLTFNCTLDEEVTSLQCFVDGQRITDCDLPILLSYADYSVGWHSLTLSFETNAGSTEFELVFNSEAVAPQPLDCDAEFSGTYFSYNCSSDEKVSSVQCLLNGEPYSDCLLSNTVIHSDFPVGLNTLEVLVNTSEGNTGGRSYVFYTEPALDIICTGSVDEYRAYFTCEANRCIFTYCSIDGGPLEPCTLPVELPYDDLHVGLRSIVTVIFDRSGSFGLAVFPYYIPPEPQLPCEAIGDGSTLVFNCTLEEEVISVNCLVDRQPLTDCSHPLYLTLADYAVGVHTLTLLFETSAGIEQFQGAFHSPAVGPRPLTCDQTFEEFTFSYNCSSDEGVSSVQCFLNGEPYSDCQLSNTIMYSDFPVGLNTLELHITTSAGNMANESFIFFVHPPPPIDLYFINNTPELVGGSVSAEFAFNRHGLRISCHLTHLDGKQDCSNGTYSHTGIPPGDYTLRVVAKDPVRGDKKVIRNRLWVHSDDANDPFCVTHLINRGWRVEGRNFTVEFTATGIATGFVCSLDSTGHIGCASPYTVSNLSPGVHQIRVVPVGCNRDYHIWSKEFIIV